MPEEKHHGERDSVSGELDSTCFSGESIDSHQSGKTGNAGKLRRPESIIRIEDQKLTDPRKVTRQIRPEQNRQVIQGYKLQVKAKVIRVIKRGRIRCRKLMKPHPDLPRDDGRKHSR